MKIDIKDLYRKWKAGECKIADLSDLELEAIRRAELDGGAFPGERPIKDDIERHRILDSPSYLATEVIDSYYKENFEPIHYVCMDEVMRPYILGEQLTLDGQTHDPKLYLGLIMLFSRDTWKSSMLWMMALWTAVYEKCVNKRDAREMYVHQVQNKAVKRGENIRDVARHNDTFRKSFPDFAAPKGQWDTMNEWRWPNFTSHSAGEWSFTAYGETSDKAGHHFSHRFIDDWETEELKTPQARLDNYERFKGMDPLKDRTVGYCPQLIAGTTYFFDGMHERTIRDGGFLVWKTPAHKGSPKAIFDLCSLDPRDPKQAKKIEQGIRKLERERADDLHFPRRLPWRELYLCARAQGPRIYNGQMLVNPVPEGETRFDPQALEDIWCNEIPGPDEMWLYLRCDPAISKKRQACETAYVMGGVTWSGWRFIIDGWIGRETLPSAIIRRGFQLVRSWQGKGYRVKSIGYESVQFQEALANMARKGVPSYEASEHGEAVPIMLRPCPVVSLERHSEISQDERIMSMDGPISRREVKIWKSCPIASKLDDQLRQFPLGNRDGIDAMQGLWEKTIPPPQPVITEASTLPLHVLELIEKAKREPGDSPQLCGTNRTVSLSSWSN